MNKKVEVMFGFLVIVLVIVGFIVAGVATVPAKADVATAGTALGLTVVTIPSDITQSEVFSKIKLLDRNGQLPVQVNSSDLGRPNPFMPI